MDDFGMLMGAYVVIEALIVYSLFVSGPDIAPGDRIATQAAGVAVYKNMFCDVKSVLIQELSFP
jgi:hypothetical protein